MAGSRKVTFLITANTTQFGKGLKNAQRKLRRFGKQTQRIGRSLTRNLSVPLAIIGGASVKMAADFETSMTKIETLVGLSGKAVQGMRKDVLRLAKETANAPQELSEALFTVTSAGLRGAEAMNVLERAAKASAIGLGDTKGVAKALTGIMQSYSKQGLTAAEATDTLIGVVREGNLEASELAPVLGRVTGIASQLGISFDQVGASIASFTRLGVSAEEAVTGLRGIMNAILKQTPKSKKALKSVGLTFEGLTDKIEKDGLAKALVDLTKSFEGNQQGLSAFAGRVRGLAAIMGTAGAQSESYLEIAQDIENSTGNLDEGFKRVSKTVAFKFKKALSSLRVEAIRLGTQLLPLAEKLINQVSGLVTKFSNLSDETKETWIQWAKWIALLGPTLFLLGKLFVALSALLSPAILTAAAITTLFAGVVVAGQWFVDNWKKISQGFSNAMLIMKIAAKRMAGAVIQAAIDIFNFYANIFPPEFLTNIFGIDLSQMALDLTGVPDLVKKMEDDVLNDMGELADGIEKYNNMAWGSMSDAAASALEKTKSAVISGLQGILNSTAIQNIIAKINEAFAISPSVGGGADGGGDGDADGDKRDIPIVTLPPLVIPPIDPEPLEKFKAEIEDTGLTWSGFVTNFKEIGGDLTAFLAGEISSAVISFGTALGTALSGAANSWETAFEKIIGVVLDFAGSLAKLAAAIGAVMLFIPGLRGAGVGLLAAATALQAIVSGVKAGISKRASNRQKRSNAQGMAHGGIVPSGFPNDTYPAMLTSGETVTPAPKALPSGMNSTEVSGEFRIKGTDLVMVLEKATQKTLR